MNIEFTFMLSNSELGLPVSYSVVKTKKTKQEKNIPALDRKREWFDRVKPGGLGWVTRIRRVAQVTDALIMKPKLDS